MQSNFEKNGSNHNHVASLNYFEELFIQEERYQSYNESFSLKYNELLIIQKPFQEDLQDDCDDNIDDENIVEAFEIVSDVIDVPNFYQDQPIHDQYSDDPKQ